MGLRGPEKGRVAPGKSSMIVRLLSQGQGGCLLEGEQGRAMQEAEDRLGVAGQYAPTLGITYQAVGQANETLGARLNRASVFDSAAAQLVLEPVDIVPGPRRDASPATTPTS